MVMMMLKVAVLIHVVLLAVEMVVVKAMGFNAEFGIEYDCDISGV